MVVRLSDIRSGQTSEKKSGVVRLKDIREKKEAVYHEENNLDTIRSSQREAQKSVGFTPKPNTQVMTYNDLHHAPEQLQSPAHNNVPKGAAKVSAVERNKDKVSRNIPLIGQFMTDLDKVADSKAAKLVKNIGEVVYTPGATMANIGGATLSATKAISKIAPNLLGNTAGRVAQTAIREAAVGAPLGVGQALAQGQDDKEALKGGAYGAALGGGLGGSASLVAQKLKGSKLASMIDSFFNKSQPVQEQPKGILALPPASAESMAAFNKRNGNVLPTNETPIYGRGDIYKPEPLALEAPNLASPTKARVVAPTKDSQALYESLTNEVDSRMSSGRIKKIDTQGYANLKAAIDDGFKNKQISKAEHIELTKLADEELTKQRNLFNQEVKNVYGEIAHPESPPLEQLMQEAYKPKKPIQTDIVQRAKAQQDMRNVSGVDLPVKTVEQRYAEANPNNKLGVNANAAMPETKIKRLSEIRQEAAAAEKVVVQPKVKRLAQIREESVLKSEVKPIETEADDLIKTKEPRLRDKVYNLLDEQEKAARARLAAKKNTLSSLPLDQYADHAVILAAKIGKGGIKLADATEYLVKEFGESIRPHAKAILNKSKGIVQETERRASKEAQDAKAFNEADAGDTTTFRNKVSRDPKKNKTTFAQKSEQIRTQFVDDLAPLEGLEKKIKGNAKDSAENNLYKLARLFRGVPEKANQIVKDRLAPIVNGIEKQGYTSQDLGDYALAVHAKDVNARDIKSGFTNKEIQATIDSLGSPEMEASRKALIKVNDDMLKELVDNQVITQELVDMLKERYPNYMPLFRQLDDDAVGFQGGLSNALANVTSPIKKLKGSEKNVIDPLENMVKNIFQSTNAAERNKVSLQLTELAKKDVDNNFIRKLDAGEEVGRKNVVSVLENGEKVRYEVEPEVYKSLLDLDKESSALLIRILQKPASLLRAGATLTPEFSLRNPLRDVVQAFVVSESGFNPLIDFPVGLIQSISKGNLYKKWVDELGAFGNVISNDRQVHKEALERVLKEPMSKKFINVINGKSLIKLLRSITDVTESATKVGEFRAALRKGASPQEAAYRSRDIMDFGRSGTNVRVTNKIVAFLNANIQGKSKLIRAFKANPAGFSARAFSSITVPTVGVFLMQKYMANDEQKKTIKESPSWLTDTFWLVPVPGTNQIARIPKPFDIGTLFSNLPERALKYTYNNDKDAFDGFARKAIADGAIPGMISAITPFMEGMTNFSFFRGSTIIPQREEGINFEDQYDVNTTETAKGLAKVTSKVVGENGPFKNFSSPRIMDNTIKGLTAGLGTYGTSAIDVLLNKFNISDNPVRPAKNVSQKPLAKAFLVNPNQSGKSMDQLYKLKTDLTTDKGSAKLRDEEFKDQEKLDYITAQTDEMSLMSKAIRSFENDRNLTAVQKRDKIDNLIKLRNNLAIETMKRIKEVDGK